MRILPLPRRARNFVGSFTRNDRDKFPPTRLVEARMDARIASRSKWTDTALLVTLSHPRYSIRTCVYKRHDLWFAENHRVDFTLPKIAERIKLAIKASLSSLRDVERSESLDNNPIYQAYKLISCFIYRCRKGSSWGMFTDYPLRFPSTFKLMLRKTLCQLARNE